MYAEFEGIYYAVRYVNTKAKFVKERKGEKINLDCSFVKDFIYMCISTFFSFENEYNSIVPSIRTEA